ncbi:hypothetical protein WP8W19C02_03970 [Enterobacter cloacae]|nr:hypothetical protein WP8W19C02_03970 [Enterobacter cloacae]
MCHESWLCYAYQAVSKLHFSGQDKKDAEQEESHARAI